MTDFITYTRRDAAKAERKRQAEQRKATTLIVIYIATIAAVTGFMLGRLY